MHWNMACLASAFMPLVALDHSEEDAQALLSETLSEFVVVYGQAWQAHFREKLGLSTVQEGDIALIERLLQAMHDSKVDFTKLFRGLSSISRDSSAQANFLRDHFIDREQIDQWLSDYIERLNAESSNDHERKKRMDAVNPKYILRNHLAQKAIEKAQEKDFTEIAMLLTILENPFAEQDEYADYANPPPPDWQSVEVSCSS
jgi:uncharacterized protein YdiU (UPF0061 family)